MPEALTSETIAKLKSNDLNHDEVQIALAAYIATDIKKFRNLTVPVDYLTAVIHKYATSIQLVADEANKKFAEGVKHSTPLYIESLDKEI